MLSRYRKLQEHRESGFTLVELLVVIIIIGILAAIAIPVFLNQRKRANDATLKSDTKNIANELTAWFGESGGRDVNDVFEITQKTHPVQMALGVFGSERVTTDPTLDWNRYDSLPHLTASPNSKVTITMNRISTGEYTAHQSGDFCLSSDHPNSNYNYSHSGVSGPGNYDKLVYYDVQLGGIVTMEKMVQAVQAGNPTSCGHFTKRYMTAKGITVP